MTTNRPRAALWLPLAVVALVLLVPLAILLGTAWLFGWKFQPVESGSMAPALPVGSLAVVQPADPSRIVPGATIVFLDPQDRTRLVAHRVVEVVGDASPRYRTRGDANPADDPYPVPVSNVQGIVAWTIPALGTAIGTVRGGPAVLLLVGLPLGLLLVTELAGLRRRIGPAPG